MCLKTYCNSPIWDYVCLAAGCRAIRLTATKRKALNQKAMALNEERERLAKLKCKACEQKAEELKEERKLLAKLKLELIKDEGATR